MIQEELEKWNEDEVVACEKKSQNKFRLSSITAFNPKSPPPVATSQKDKSTASEKKYRMSSIIDLQQPPESLRPWLERNTPTGHIPEALLGSSNNKGGCQIGGGIVADYKRRNPYFLSDFTDGVSWKTLSASIFMFCAVVTSTVALGDLASRETDKKVGITEYLLLQSIAGLIHATFSACPLPILRPTGPITAFMIDLNRLSLWIGAGYFTVLSWVGLWVGSFTICVAFFDWSKYIVLCTRFLHDIYAVFVCTIYISDGILEVAQRFQEVPWIEAFFASYLFMFCIFLATVLYYADRSTILKQSWRQTISDYALPLSVVICIFISYSVKDNVDIARIEMPPKFEPSDIDITNGNVRSWYQGFTPGDDSQIGMVAIASISFVAAIPIVALFYIDHLFSCILGQKPELGLKKGEYYHSSMLIMGICNLILPSFGLPFVTASLPHSPQFTKALTTYNKSKTPWEVVKVHESRIAPTLVYALCLCGLVFPSVLEMCPGGVVNGILTFVGIAGILPGTGNQLMDRTLLLFTAPSGFPSATANSAVAPYSELPWYRIHLYTIIQLACLAGCWGMRFAGPFSLAFPLVVVSFIPLRLCILPKLFSQNELSVLDADERHQHLQQVNNNNAKSVV